MDILFYSCEISGNELALVAVSDWTFCSSVIKLVEVSGS